MVGYAGRYDGPDGKKLQWVGEVYVNFAKAERLAPVLYHFASEIADKIPALPIQGIGGVGDVAFCGAPEGGKALAVHLARIFGVEYIFPEKRVVKAATETAREVSVMEFARHEPTPGSKVFIVEDVCNNFTATMELIELIKKNGATVVGIVCFLNRSLEVDDLFVGTMPAVPVISLVRQLIMQWKQNDPAVASDVLANNVAWKPKHDWDRLAEAMAKAA